ncbi:MAG: hypothetical protein ACRDBO_06790 [Lachnospiraceae bacterium]
MRMSDACFNRVLFVCGVVLAGMEFCKQVLLYFVVYDHYFDWWFFPFHLCSIPMYLCLLFPWLSARVQTVCGTFMQNFNLLGAGAALVAADGFPRQHWYLLFHAYFWHILLLLIGIFIAVGGRSDRRWRGYLNSLLLFVAACLVATAINVFSPGMRADMFYISPFHPIEQPIFYQIGQQLGILAGHLLYLLSICGGAGLIHFLCRLLFLRHLW